jgi:hypothetical protein
MRAPTYQYWRIVAITFGFGSLAMRWQRNIAKVAMARRLGVRLYWMWRNDWEYSYRVKFGSNAGQLGIRHGVN